MNSNIFDRVEDFVRETIIDDIDLEFIPQNKRIQKRGDKQLQKNIEEAKNPRKAEKK